MIAMDSNRVDPSSRTSAGTTACAFTARYSGFNCSPCIRLTGISSAFTPFSASAMRTRQAASERQKP
jgi:hypothetical protein